MTFLAPVPALIAAAVLVPALLVLYLLKLRRRPVRVGSILFWPRATEDVQANVPLRWLRPSLLLLLHLLILALLLLAFARPALPGASLGSARVVLMVDASASMNARDGNAPGALADPRTPTRLDRAIERAGEVLREGSGGGLSGGGRSVAVVSLTAQPRVLTGWTRSAALAREALSQVTPTDQPADLARALRLVDSLASDLVGEDDAPGQEAPLIILLSDGSFREQELPHASGLRVRFERIGPAPEQDAAPENIGIVRLSARRDDDDPSLVRVFARLHSNAPVALDVPITLWLSGEAMQRRAVRIPAGTEDAPGVLEQVLSLPGVTQGVVTLTIDRPDALPSDDSASLVMPRVVTPALALVRPASTDAALQGEGQAGAFLLEDLLRELRPRELRILSPEQARRGLEQGDLADIDLFVLDGAAPDRTLPVPAIALGVVPRGIGLEVTQERVTPRAGSIFWDRRHPLMQGVSLDGLAVSSTLALRAADAQLATAQSGPESPPETQPEAQPETQPNAGTGDVRAPDVLARTDDTPLIVRTPGPARGVGSRSVVVGFNLLDSNWPLQPSFAVFMAGAVDALTLRDEARAGVAFPTDAPVRLRAPGTGRVTLTTPSGGTLVVREDAPPPGAPASTPPSASPDGAGLSVRTHAGDDTPLSVGVLERAGIYTVQGPRGTDRVVAVNLLDETETALRAPQTVTVAGRPLAGVSGGPVQREVWTWFVLAAFVLLSLEWVVYARQVRA